MAPRPVLDTRHTLFGERFDVLPFFPPKATIKILVVLEGSIQPGSDTPGFDFALGHVVKALRNEPLGFVRFVVHFARHGQAGAALTVDKAAGPWEERYDGFRFDSEHDGARVIDGYDQIWCFGIEPIIHDDGDNASVTGSAYSAGAAELAVLSAWMDAGGGLLAMGDHNFLGSAMCWNMPRVGTMRAWLKHTDDGRSVPNRTGTDRHDTHQPATPDQAAGVEVIPGDAQSDAVPQPLDWRRYPVFRSRLLRSYAPHPLLCAGSLGIVDVLPDHAHEGLVIEDHLIDLTAKTWHDGSKDEYPEVSGVRPAPEVIGWVTALGDPPLQHAKGDQPNRRFAAIGVYNGHRAGVGRVVVDSTWHHWFDVNLSGFDAASTDYRKIVRYFQNCAIWLAPPADQARMLAWTAFWASVSVEGYEDLTSDTSVLTLGGTTLNLLGQATGECIVWSWLIDILPPELELHFRRPFPFPDPCLSCPLEGLIPQAVLGAVVRQFLPVRDAILAGPWTRRGYTCEVPLVDAQQALERGVEEGLAEVLRIAEANQEMLDLVVNGLGTTLKALNKGESAPK